MPKLRSSTLRSAVQPVDSDGWIKTRPDRPQTPELIRRRAIYEAMRDLDEVIYAILMPDGLIKIGHTADLRKRRGGLTTEMTAILAVIPGTHEEEQTLHKRFRSFAVRGREYYWQAPEIVAFINEIRVKAGVPAIGL